MYGDGGSESEYPGQNKHRLLSTRVFESGPPVPVNQQEVLSTTKTEELTKKKKTDTLVTKQIETRVRREIVVTEDGEILEDSGPKVTTETTENSRTEEQENTECKTSGPDDPGPGWVLVPGSKVVNETRQKTETKNDTHEERTDTEITEEIGGLSREEITKALKQRELAALKARRDSSSTCSPAPSRSHVLHHSSHKVVDTEETDEVSEFKDGAVSTETKKRTNREEYFDGDEDDVDNGSGGGDWPPKIMSKQPPTTTTTTTITAVNGESGSRVNGKETTGRPSSTETFNWVNHHFGSQDDLDGNQVNIVTPSVNESSNQRKVHYASRQQMPLPGSTRPARTPEKATEHSTERRQYFLGEDPGVGQRFTGIATDNANVTSYGSHSLGKPLRTRIVPTNSSTLGRNPELERSTSVDAAMLPPPSVTDIIHSLRSKAFLEKESAAVSIRDDDSVFGNNRSVLYRPLRTKPPPVKQHVIKIAIRSDDSDCSTPNTASNRSAFNFDRDLYKNNHCQNRNVQDAGGGIVKSAINNLLKNRLNDASALSRNGRDSNLTSTKTYLTVSSPNVNKIREPPRGLHVQTTSRSQPPKRNVFNGNRSQSIGNLNNGFHDHHTPVPGSPMSSGYGTYSSRDGVTRMHVANGSTSKRYNPQRQSPDYYYNSSSADRDDLRRSTYKYSSAAPSPVWSSGGGSPPSSPSYTNRIKLPSPVPPSRGSSSSSMSPRSPPPPLTRPYSPSCYYNKYEQRFNDDYVTKSSSKTLPSSRIRGPSAWADHSRTPSPPPPFSPRPPSPVLPSRSTSGSLVDDAASNASTNRSSRSTNPGSRAGSLEGAIPNPKERVEVTNRKKVTTTSSKKHEIELPDTDYYYDRAVVNGNLGRLDRSKSRSIVQVGLRNDWDGR